jgi:hypothetical protein
MDAALWTLIAVMAPDGWVQMLMPVHSVAVVDSDRMSIPDSEVGGSCPAVGRSSVDRPGFGAMVIRGVSVVETTVTVGPAPGTPVKLAVDAPSNTPDAYRLP